MIVAFLLYNLSSKIGNSLLTVRMINSIFIRAEFCVGGFGDFPEGCDLQELEQAAAVEVSLPDCLEKIKKKRGF